MTVWQVATGLVTPLSLNDRSGWQKKHRLTSQVRQTVAWNARALRIPTLTHAHVRVVYVPAVDRRRDPDNLWATGKPAVDGLVDAGVLPDDTARHVTRYDPTIAPVDPGRAGCRVFLKVWTEP